LVRSANVLMSQISSCLTAYMNTVNKVKDSTTKNQRLPVIRNLVLTAKYFEKMKLPRTINMQKMRYTMKKAFHETSINFKLLYIS
jgi:hypothetical protein